MYVDVLEEIFFPEAYLAILKSPHGPINKLLNPYFPTYLLPFLITIWCRYPYHVPTKIISWRLEFRQISTSIGSKCKEHMTLSWLEVRSWASVKRTWPLLKLAPLRHCLTFPLAHKRAHSFWLKKKKILCPTCCCALAICVIWIIEIGICSEESIFLFVSKQNLLPLTVQGFLA